MVSLLSAVACGGQTGGTDAGRRRHPEPTPHPPPAATCPARAAAPLLLPGVEPILDALPGILADERLERSLVKDALPFRLARVDPIAEDHVDATHVDLARAERDAVCSRLLRDGL